MGFVKEYKNYREEFPEWEYLNKIGVRDMFDKPLRKNILSLVVDRENNYYLIPLGHTNINRDNKEINFFALCMDDKVINMEVDEQSSGRARDKTFECHWNIEKIDFPLGWSFDKISKQELKEIIIDAFTAKTYAINLQMKVRYSNTGVQNTALFRQRRSIRPRQWIV